MFSVTESLIRDRTEGGKISEIKTDDWIETAREKRKFRFKLSSRNVNSGIFKSPDLSRFCVHRFNLIYIRNFPWTSRASVDVETTRAPHKSTIRSKIFTKS